MSIVDSSVTGSSQPETASAPQRPVVLHRIREVRRQQRVSIRVAARRIGCTVSRLRDQEREGADLLLSDLYAWHRALGVPVQELLVESEDPLSPPVLEMSRVIRLAKTIATIQDRSESESISRLADMLMGQLLEMMPELSDVGPWPGSRTRPLDDLGRVTERRLSDETLFREELY